MKRFEVVFIKVQKLISGQNSPVILAKQEFESESENITIPVPIGYSIMTVTELLEPAKLNNSLNAKN